MKTLEEFLDDNYMTIKNRCMADNGAVIIIESEVENLYRLTLEEDYIDVSLDDIEELANDMILFTKRMRLKINDK